MFFKDVRFQASEKSYVPEGEANVKRLAIYS